MGDASGRARPPDCQDIADALKGRTSPKTGLRALERIEGHLDACCGIDLERIKTIKELRAELDVWTDAVSEILEWLQHDDWPACTKDGQRGSDRFRSLYTLETLFACEVDRKVGYDCKIGRLKAEIGLMETEIERLKGEIIDRGRCHGLLMAKGLA